MQDLSKKKPSQYSHFFIRLLAGILSVGFIPLFILNVGRGWAPFVTEPDVYSAVTVVLAFLFSMLSLRRINWFPGTGSTLTCIPVLTGWFALLISIHLIFRLPYSLAYLGLGFMLAMAWLLIQAYILKKTHRTHLAYVPLGRALHINDIKGPDWYRLERPELPDQPLMDAIVADLHAPDLSDEWQKFLAECSLQHMLVFNIRQAEESLTGRVKIRHMYENNLGSLLPSPVYMVIKYVLECSLIVLSLPVTLPVMLVTALLIKLEDRGSIFYNQERVGYRGKPFLMYKFRSMTENKAVNQQQTTSKTDARITRIGRVIRKVRIDELPQFLNVLKGDMALIGPRAEYKKFADELEQQVPFYQYRHIVKPGITGWAQVMHGYATGADETQVKIEHDFYYIKYFSFWLDLIIVFKTLRTMLTGFGAR